jgi:hypothetical protein
MIALVFAALLQSAPAPRSGPLAVPAQSTAVAQATAPPSPATSPPPTPPPPSATTTPVPAPSPSASPGPYAYVMNYPPPAAPTAGPVITQVSLNASTIHPGGPLMIQVTTSPNVVGVEARCFGRFLAIPQISPGIFALNYTLPMGIPPYLFRTFDIVIAAATPDGQQTTKDFALTLAH